MSIASQRPAQSLLEAIIAIGVILVATVSATTLIVTTITSGQVSLEKTQAVNFAREGVEIVRSIRDSNWLKRAQNISDGSGTTVAWDDTGSTTDGYIPMSILNAPSTYVSSFDATTNAGVLTLLSNSTITGDDIVLQGGKYIQNCTSNCVATKYSRTITITKRSDGSAGDYLDVQSTITWNGRSARPLTLTERLYDWR